jgi:hypothetical protein
MSYRDVARRLAVLKAEDKARRQRVHTRVLQQLSDDEFARFRAVVWRVDEAGLGSDVAVSEDEKQTLCHVEALTRADPEMRPADLMHLPVEWMKEYGYAP